jgi:hypothetical protein
MTQTTDKTFTHIGIEKPTQKKLAILAQVRGVRIYELAAGLADHAWNDALSQGLVTPAMLQPQKAHWVGKPYPRADAIEMVEADGTKILKAVRVHKPARRRLAKS